jgi:hypothetical protein
VNHSSTSPLARTFARTLAVFLLLVVAGCGKDGKDARETLEKPMKLKALEGAILGQSTEVVIRKLGTPDTTQALNDGTGAWWFYEGALEEGDVAWLWISPQGKVMEVRRKEVRRK